MKPHGGKVRELCFLNCFYLMTESVSASAYPEPERGQQLQDLGSCLLLDTNLIQLVKPFPGHRFNKQPLRCSRICKMIPLLSSAALVRGWRDEEQQK